MYDRWLERARRHGAQFADLRIQRIESSSLELRNGKIERSIGGREEGLGVRVLAKGAWGFATANDLRVGSLEAAIDHALRLAKAVGAQARDAAAVAPIEPVVATVEWRPRVAPADVDPTQKEDIVRRMHAVVKAFKEVKSTSGSYGDRTTEQEYYSSDGARVKTSVTRTVAQVHFTAKGHGRITSRRIRVGATKGFEAFQDEDIEAKARAGAEATVRLLRAPAPPAGRLPVVLDPELTGVFAHEALGHASEGDLISAGESCLAGKMGHKVGSEIVTLRDDSTPRGVFGSFPYDDEGQIGRSRVLLRKGIVVGHLTDRANAHKLKHPLTASARAESYASRPLVRMTNTVIDPGDLTFEELLEPIKHGVYAVGSRGGQVDTAKGSFLFNAQESYLIKNGEIAHPLRDVSLTGSTLATLAAIDGLGKDFHWGDPGYCGKGQYVPVCDGGPNTRIRECVIGGSA